MEAKLFWISMGCGLYAFLLKKFLRRSGGLQSRRFTSFVHGSFCLLVGVGAGSLLSSYWENPELVGPLMAGLGALGFVGGFVWCWVGFPSTKNTERLLRKDLEWADTGFSSILLAAFIMYFFLQAFKIPSGSMRDTLKEGDHLFVNKFIYGFRVPLTHKKVLRTRSVERGDIVIFQFPSKDKKEQHHGKDFIKRAIGLPGDVVEIKDKKVYVNNQPIDEPYVKFDDPGVIPTVSVLEDPVVFQSHWQSGNLAQANIVRDNFGPVTVPPGHYLCLGDNRDRSYDSRFWGPLPDTHLKGRAWVLYFPFRRVKVIR
jgi:signal peptidase I